jgi:integrase
MTEGKEWLKKKVRELDDHGTEHLENARATFNDLADYYEKHYLTEPQYVDERKVSGMRTWKNARWTLSTLRAHFGKKKIRQIRHGDIENFKRTRLATPTRRGTQMTIASVNRELALLRAILAQAIRDGVLIHNPFIGKTRLISISDERRRERLISFEDEERLLACCTGPREHLRALIICALDTGMRRGEILKLQWADVDFASRVITVKAFNTKTMRQRTVAMTARLTDELEALRIKASPQPDELVFGITDNFKRAFRTACKMAGLDDLRYHDLRHVAATRLIQAGLPREQVGRILGHTQANTTYRYINVDAETIHRAAELLDEAREQRADTEREAVM